MARADRIARRRERWSNWNSSPRREEKRRKIRSLVGEATEGWNKVRSWWDDVTPWDTRRERAAADEAADRVRDFDYEGARDEAEEEAADMYTVRDPAAWIDEMVEMATSIPNVFEWLSQQGIDLNDLSGEYAGMQDLINQLAAGPTDEDRDAAYEHAARLMGLSADEAYEMIGNLTRAIAGGQEGAEGMSAEEQALRERQNQANIREMEARARRMVENSMADTGSTARMLAVSDEAIRAINNAQIQQDVALAQEEAERKMAQWQSQMQAQAQMVATNEAGFAQYISLMQDGLSRAIEGYSSKISAMLAENEQYFRAYGQELARVETAIDGLYKAVQAQLGVNQAYLDAVDQLYAARVQPILDQAQAFLTGQEIEAGSQGFLGWAIDLVVDVLPAVVELVKLVPKG